MMYSEDSLKITENEDGTFAIEWDSNDPNYSMLNGMTEEELNNYFTRALEEYIKEQENDSNDSGS